VGDDAEREAAVADVGLVVLTVIVFGLLVMLLRGAERL
jgi:hypothetical protein